jgi:hypothetical protein
MTERPRLLETFSAAVILSADLSWSPWEWLNQNAAEAQDLCCWLAKAAGHD